MFITFFSTDDMNLSKIKDQDSLGISWDTVIVATAACVSQIS